MRCSKLILLFFCTFLIACGESNNTDDNLSPNIPATGNQTGTVSIAISDSPMKGVVGVIIQLDELVMTDESNIQHRYSLKDKNFNLLDYQGKQSITIVDGLSIPVGNYHNVHMSVIAGDGNNGCYVEDGQGIHPMQVQDGMLPLMDFSVSANQHHAFTMEIGLYMGLNRDGDFNYTLRHFGSWSVNNTSMGHLLGEMDPQWIADCEAGNAVTLPPSGSFSHLAYLYPSSVTRLEQMGDVHDSGSNGHVAPIAVSPMRQDRSGNWFFEMGFLPEGTYRVGYSCLGHLDNPNMDDIQNGSFSMFADAGTVTIRAGANGGSQTVIQCGKGNGGHHGG
ncbi:DUF4382 domain-containing protein [Shewanella litorisediminis]|uniref:DUF4382 domain-containing protein n=1 Tax=Shewanella litorisediminis TaxID=1173586 RepID=A0ABX7G0Q3_9GAMM|nr:DUF4382 domain-containing protein [Shewanella litorisediminis]MCL2918058.1 DUF4382 domain-containing protein [Shewanella litorisediminis]QRH00881.1 DUF4382 domain-containing protein [Shewanella litorisediminis]